MFARFACPATAQKNTIDRVSVSIYNIMYGKISIEGFPMNENTLVQIVRNHIPNLTIQTHCMDDTGQNNAILIVNDEWVFKFPRHTGEINALKKEAAALRVLQPRLSLAVPDIRYDFLDEAPVSEAFCGYRKLPGQPMLRAHFDDMPDKAALAAQLGIFLKQLHSAPYDGLDIATMDALRFFEDMYADVQKHLLAHMREDAARTVISDFESYLDASKLHAYAPCLIHGDCGPTNILADEERITGVIDFGSICVGDPAMDIACLMGKFGYGEAFVMQMQDAYPEVDSYLPRARFYIRTFALQDALFGVKHGDQKAYDFGMKDYV